MDLKLFENEKIQGGRLTINESFDITKYETKQIVQVTEATGESKKKLIVQPVIEAIHSGRTRNGNIYTPEKLRGDYEKKSGAYSFTSPYPKPMLKNHDHYCEPTGRITHAEFKNTSAAGKPCINIKPEITEPDAIEKVLDGRYLTVSIGASTDEAICNICGTDVLKDGFCGHFRNEEYDGVVCGWICGDLFFDECSWVNVPACSTAGVISTGEVITKESANDEEALEVEPKEETEPTTEKDNTETTDVEEETVEENLVATDEESDEVEVSEDTTDDEEAQVKTDTKEEAEEDPTKEIEPKPLTESLEESEAVVIIKNELSESKKLVEEKNIEISNLKEDINEIRKDFDEALEQVNVYKNESISTLSLATVQIMETLNMISSEEREFTIEKLMDKDKDNLQAEFNILLDKFKEESKKRLYSGTNTNPDYSKDLESKRALTKEEAQDKQINALKALFAGKVNR